MTTIPDRPGGLINIRVPVRLGQGDEVTLLVKVGENDARKLVSAPRKVIRDVDVHLVQLIRDGLRRFFQSEETGDQQ